MRTRQADGSARRGWWQATALALALGPLPTGCAHEYPAQDVDTDAVTDEEAQRAGDGGRGDAAVKDASVGDADAGDGRVRDSAPPRMCAMPAGESDCFYCGASECCEEILVYVERAAPFDDCLDACANASSSSACFDACEDRFPLSVPLLLTVEQCLRDNCLVECEP